MKLPASILFSRIPDAFTFHRTRRNQRRGAVMVLFVVGLVPIVAFMAFAIDIGMMTVAQTQLRDAADAAALAGCRALNGNQATNNNYAGATPAAQTAVTNNVVLGLPMAASQLTVNIGRYAYNATDQQFEGNFPGTTGNWDMVQAVVTANVTSSLGFGKIFNFSLPNFTATSTAAHRARDVCVILDFSGSMRFSSLMGLLYYGNRSCNNQDTNVPAFGQYSAGSSSTGMPAASAAAPYGNANITTTTADGRPPVVQDFYTNSNGTPAFSAASSSYAATPGGDVPPLTNKGAGSSYAQTVAQVLNISNPTNSTYVTTFETKGYAGYNMTSGTAGFQGYTQGPGYWGKTFYLWPPDPTNDWRGKYFTFSGGSADNSVLWNGSGNWQAPSSGGYQINYSAILNFIQNIGPNAFPSQLQSGRIVYYTSIPNTINTSTWPPTDLNQRFWKSYIDYVLGVMQVSATQYVVINNGTAGYTGYGSDFQWGTVKITAASSLSGNPKPYMFYGDNPLRPICSFWFGPMTMIDFLGNYNLWYSGYGNDASNFCWWPGTCHESPMYELKLGIAAALNDAQNNHPNDFYSVIMFSTPLTSSTDTSASRFNRVRVALGQNFTNCNQCLWYPPETVGTTNTVTPYGVSSGGSGSIASNNLEVPRAMGGTCYSYALMLAYNQFSSNSSLQSFNPTQPTGDAGGNGRIGAQKIIIFETDGAPNVSAQASFVNDGSYQSYYKVRYNSATPASSDYPNSVTTYADNDPSLVNQILTLVQQLAAQYTAEGYSTPSRPLLFNCLAFGPVIDSAGIATLNQMQQAGNVNDGMPSYKIINGSAATVVSDLQQAIAAILQDGVQVSLIQ
jgi:Flp pilus assembly protein TadG